LRARRVNEKGELKRELTLGAAELDRLERELVASLTARAREHAEGAARP
jgi:hypothetical protein